MWKWVVLCMVATVAVGASSAGAQVIEQEAEPENWLAFVSHSAGWARSHRWITAVTPDITLYRDGRMVWIDHNAKGSGMWRTGRLTPFQLAKIKTRLKRSQFLELPVDPPRRERQEIFDAGAMRFGYREGGKSRTVEVDAPTMFGPLSSASFAVRGAIEMEQALRASFPGDHRPFRPASIRVGLLHIKTEVENAPDWPLKDSPKPVNSSAGPYSYYSGEAASQVLAALDRSRFVRVGEAAYEAFWAPAMISPETGRDGFPGGREASPVASAKPERQLTGHTDAVTCVRWSPNGEYLVTATPNTDSPRIWSAKTGKLVRTFEGHGPNYAVEWSPSSKRLLFGAGISFLRELSGKMLALEVRSGGWFAGAVSWSADNRYLALEDPLQVVVVASGKQRWKSERQRNSGIAFLNEEKGLVCAGVDGSVVVRSVANGNVLRTLRGPLFDDWAGGIHFPLAINRWHIAVPGLSDGTVRRWNVDTGAEATPLRLDGPTPNSLAWSRDGRTLAATAGLTLWLWDTKTGKRRTIQSPSELYSATWSPDGRRIAAGCADGTVRIWRVDAAKAG